MLLPETIEREYRFRLALRMGLPIFGLILALISSTLITTYESLQPTFYVGSILLLTFSIYFILFLIYRGFDVIITEPTSKIFTREYLYKYLQEDIQKKDKYTLILISIDNLHHINNQYGIKNGDKVIREVAKYLGQYFIDKKINNFPLGHIAGADFVIGLDGSSEEYKTLLELLCLKSSEFKVDDIEVNLTGSMIDTSFSINLDFMIEKLFELQEENRTKNIVVEKQMINPNDLESYVINAIQSESLSITTQDIFEDNKSVIKECFFKLKSANGKILHPKSYMKVINKLGLTSQYDIMILQKTILNCLDEDNTIHAISIAPTSLRNHDFLAKAKEILRDNPDAYGRVIFILSETEYYSHIDRYNAILKSLNNLGVKIAIDRLGSIHTSFLYLRDLEIDIVRFDTYYTKDIKNKKNKDIIEGFNLMAHSRGVKTWMRLVENQDVLDYANKIGVDYTQGKALAPLIKIFED